MAISTAVSVEEYFEMLLKSDVKLEYRAGEIVAMSGARPNHNLLAMSLVMLLGLCLREHGCKVYSNDQLVHIEASERFAFPDVVIACDEPRFKDTKRGLPSLVNPRIIVEVLSNNTEFSDRNDKYRAYRTLESLEEYVLISSREKIVEVFRRNNSHEWLHRIFDESNPTIKIGPCELNLHDLCFDIVFEVE